MKIYSGMIMMILKKKTCPKKRRNKIARKAINEILTKDKKTSYE